MTKTLPIVLAAVLAGLTACGSEPPTLQSPAPSTETTIPDTTTTLAPPPSSTTSTAVDVSLFDERMALLAEPLHARGSQCIILFVAVNDDETVSVTLELEPEGLQPGDEGDAEIPHLTHGSVTFGKNLGANACTDVGDLPYPEHAETWPLVSGRVHYEVSTGSPCLSARIVATDLHALRPDGEHVPLQDITIVNDRYTDWFPDGCSPPLPPTTTTPLTVPDIHEPPVPAVSAGGVTVDVRPWAWCWQAACVDGSPPAPLPEVAADGRVIVEFPEPDWTFNATFRAAETPCARHQSAELERLDAHTFELRPVGPAGTYDVTLHGIGMGDVIASFRWTTTVDGPLAEPTAFVAILADHDGRVDSYGVELSITNLATTPVDARATMTVTAAGGESLTFDASRTVPSECDPEGTVMFRGPNERGLEAATLGAAPFQYVVELELDGVVHTATATWPDDEAPDFAPNVPLEFTPPLPSLEAAARMDG